MVADDDDEWMSTEDVAAYLGIKPNSVSAYLTREQIPAPTYFGGSPMWRRTTIEAWREPGRRRP